MICKNYSETCHGKWKNCSLKLISSSSLSHDIFFKGCLLPMREIGLENNVRNGAFWLVEQKTVISAILKFSTDDSIAFNQRFAMMSKCSIPCNNSKVVWHCTRYLRLNKGKWKYRVHYLRKVCWKLSWEMEKLLSYPHDEQFVHFRQYFPQVVCCQPQVIGVC